MHAFKPAVIVFSTAYHPLVGGAEVAIEEVADRLKERFDFYVVTHRVRRDLPRRERYRGVTIVRCGLGWAWERWFVFPFLACLAGFKIAHTHRRVILWGVMVSYASIGAFFIKILRPDIPFVLTLQEGDSEAHLTYGKLGLTGLWWRMLLKAADEVTAISMYLAGYARRRGFDGTLSVVPNGVDIATFRPPAPRARAPGGEFVIVTTSRLVHKNAVDILIRAVAILKKEALQIRCRIIGGGRERQKLERLAAELGLDRDVTFLGAIAHREIPSHLWDADLFVRPSRSEGMGNSFVEALAAGLPIIGTPVGGITDIIEDGTTGLFSRLDDPHDLAQKILSLMRDPALARALALNGRKMVEERFSWDGIARRYAEIFDGRLSQAPAITIATPLLPPDLGGVGYYARHLAEEFAARGWRVSIVSYAGAGVRKNLDSGIRTTLVSLCYPTLIRHILFFAAMLRRTRGSDVILALDQFSAGFPAMAAARCRGIPYVTRMEGDFLWESYVERRHCDITLSDFWRGVRRLTLKERLIRRGIEEVLHRAARVTFSSQWRMKMLDGAFPFLAEKSVIIRNVWPAVSSGKMREERRENIVLWAGRMIYLKNLDRLIRAFVRLESGYELHLIGAGPERAHIEEFARGMKQGAIHVFGPVGHEELRRRMASAAMVVLPSFSDVGPNLIADAMAARTPFILTRESGYVEHLGACALLVDPLSEDDIAEKLRTLADARTREEYRARMDGCVPERNWKDAAEEWMNLFSEVVLRPNQS